MKTLEESKQVTAGEPGTTGHLLPPPDNTEVVCNPLTLTCPLGSGTLNALSCYHLSEWVLKVEHKWRHKSRELRELLVE